MQERLLQFIWQFQYFNKNELETSAGEPLIIIKQGYHNSDQGPDFLNARVKIGRQVWAGNIELHVNATDWIKHGHSADNNYKNVILHVVWNNDWKIPAVNIPLVELKTRVPKVLLEQYNQWMESVQTIPCSGLISQVNDLVWLGWKERLLIERLERKREDTKRRLISNNEDWEEVFWQLLARSYGLKVNADVFEELACRIPYRQVMNKHHLYEESLWLWLYRLLQTGNYPLLFSRIRPAASPEVRIKKLAALLLKYRYLWDMVLQTQHVKQLKPDFLILAIINAVIPVLYGYGSYYEQDELVEKSIEWSNRLPAEKNGITFKFEKLGVVNRVVADSQALVELYTQYCHNKRCLECAIGNAILKRKV